MTMAGIIDRIKQTFGSANDSEVARLLGVLPKKLAVWKLRNTIPYEELMQFCKKETISFEWLLTGEGPRPTRLFSDPRLNKIIEILESLDDDTIRILANSASKKQQKSKLESIVDTVSDLLNGHKKLVN